MCVFQEIFPPRALETHETLETNKSVLNLWCLTITVPLQLFHVILFHFGSLVVSAPAIKMSIISLCVFLSSLSVALLPRSLRLSLCHYCELIWKAKCLQAVSNPLTLLSMMKLRSHQKTMEKHRGCEAERRYSVAHWAVALFSGFLIVGCTFTGIHASNHPTVKVLRCSHSSSRPASSKEDKKKKFSFKF